MYMYICVCIHNVNIVHLLFFKLRVSLKLYIKDLHKMYHVLHEKNYIIYLSSQKYN